MTFGTNRWVPMDSASQSPDARKRRSNAVLAVATIIALLVASYIGGYAIWRHSDACTLVTREDWARDYVGYPLERDFIAIGCDDYGDRAFIYLFWPALRVETLVRGIGCCAGSSDADIIIRW